MKYFTDYDTELLIFLNNLGSENQDFFWSTITRIIFWIPLFIWLFYVVYRRFSRKEFYRISGTMFALVATALLLTDYVKNFVLRARPVNNEHVFHSLRIMIKPVDYSFYSGHACSSFAITTLFFLLVRKRVKFAWIYYLWPFLFSYSRIYLGVHFPSDVVVGAIIGITLAFVFYKLHLYFTNRIDKGKEQVVS